MPSLVRTFRLLAAGTFLAASACSGPTGLGGGGKSQDDSETENKTPQDPKKPTDDSEGLPGYLTDPNLVSVKTQDGKTVVKAPAGAVEAEEGTPDQVDVRIYEANGDDFQAPREAEDGTTKLPAKLLAKSDVHADGSFVVEVELAASRLVLVVLTPQASSDEVRVKSGKGVAFGTADAPFASVDPELLKEDRRPNTGAETATATEAATETCAGSKVQGACWYLSAAGASCKATCEGHGGYDDRTNRIAGFAGTQAFCYEVLEALGRTGTALGSVADAPGLGCSATPQLRVRWTFSATTAEAALGAYERACACRE